MDVQLLLLLALIGPFCAFTHANPTGFPPTTPAGDVGSIAPEIPATHTDAEDNAVPIHTTEGPTKDLQVITGAPPPEPETAAGEVVSEATEAPSAPAVATTEEPVIETEAPIAATPAAPELLVTDAPVVETAAPTEPAETEVQPAATGASETEMGSDVLIEDDINAGLSSGQVAGIVIGALLALVIIIAVVIAVVRRMGKYSP